MLNRIFSTDSPKAVKADAFGWLNAIHYMAPADVAGVGNLCPWSTAPCRALCLGLTSGQAGMVKDINSDRDQGNNVRASRKAKARRFMRDRQAYMDDVVRSIELAQAQAARMGKKLCVRMNGSTDIAWEGISCNREDFQHRNIFSAFPDVQFVDYTKNPTRFKRALPANYHLTFSRSEANDITAMGLLAQGHNVAVVFANPPAAGSQWYGFTVVDGDQHDLRHLDPRGDRGFVIALSPKGRKAKKDTTGFVVR